MIVAPVLGRQAVQIDSKRYYINGHSTERFSTTDLMPLVVTNWSHSGSLDLGIRRREQTRDSHGVRDAVLLDEERDLYQGDVSVWRD
jgi:hypothetical protein